MKRTAAMMAAALAASAALAVASVVAAVSAPSKAELAQLFGSQLECATQRAAAFAGESPVDAGDIRKAVDKCMSAVVLAQDLPGPGQGVKHLAAIPLTVSDLRREALVQAVRERVDLCANAGVPAERFAASCPQIFVLDQDAMNTARSR